MSRILLIDNYDSFTWNLVHYLKEITMDEICVYRNDEISIEEANNFDRIVLSPGPGVPSEAGILIPLLKAYSSVKPVLGVCLGHQAIAEASGGKLKQLDEVVHGLQRNCKVLTDDLLFQDIPDEFMVGRYHSWVVDEEYLPSGFLILATDEHSEIMAMKHEHFPLYSVQFHPESVMTPYGKQLLKNWLKISA